MDIAKEPKQIHELYGTEPGKVSFANNCLLARRLVERGVRFVQLFHWGWDQHGDSQDNDILDGLGRTVQADGPGLRRAIKDLKQRGLLDDTLVDLGRRVRPHADERGAQRLEVPRPRPPSARLHDLAGRRRRQARPHLRRDRRARLPRRRRTESTSTICRRRSCTCSASTTRS